MTESELALTWVMLSFLLPSAVFSFFGGALVDRLQKKLIIVASQVLTTVSTLAFAFIIYFGEVNFWHFICFGLFNGTVLALTMPARMAVIPDLVATTSLTNALALSNSTFSLARVVGPHLAGYLIALFAGGGEQDYTKAVGLVFFLITFLYIASTIGTLFLHYRGDPIRTTQKALARDFLEGMLYLKQNRIVIGLLLMSLLTMIFGFSAQFLLPAVNVKIFDGGAQSLGYLQAAVGVGALSGALILARLGDIGHKGRVMFTLAHLWAICIAVLPFVQNFVLSMFVLSLIGAFSAGISALIMSLVQLSVSARMRGRITSIMWATHGCIPLGMIPIGLMAELFNIQVALVTATLMMVGSTIAVKSYIPEVAKIRRGHSEIDRQMSETQKFGGQDTQLEQPTRRLD